MDVLIRYGFTIEEIKNLIDSNPNINNVEDKSIYDLIDLLGLVGCPANQIKNIFICNPFCISNNIKDIELLINELKILDIKKINLLLDSNPYILNLTNIDIKNMINKKTNDGLTKEEIVKEFINNPERII